MAKEKSINEMRDEVTQLNTRAKEIIEKGKAESRKLNDEENKEVNGIVAEINALNVDIATREAMNAGQGRVHAPANGERFSLRRAIVAQMTGQPQREAEAQVITGGDVAFVSANVAPINSKKIYGESQSEQKTDVNEQKENS